MTFASYKFEYINKYKGYKFEYINKYKLHFIIKLIKL